MRCPLRAAVLVVAALTSATVARAEDLAFGGSIRGHGGLATADSPLRPAIGMDEPDPLRGSAPRAKGSNLGFGFGSELFVVFHGVRFGLDATILLSDAYRLSNATLGDGFTASTRSASTYDFDLFIGRAFLIGSTRPYVDLRVGLDVLQTSIRLDHPTLGFVGATQYDAVRLLIGPRAGVLVPLAKLPTIGGLYFDAGLEVGLLGFSRLVGFAGIAARLGTDERARPIDDSNRRPVQAFPAR